MSPRPSSLLTGRSTVRSIRAKYEEIYRDGSVWLRTGLLGRTRLLCGLARRDLRGARLLDVGCGGGRMPLLASGLVREALGIDPAGAAIAAADRLAATLRLPNVRFRKASLENLDASERFDVITLLGVLEHVPEPAPFIRRIVRHLDRGGLLVIEVPSFQNFRGDVYMTLRTLMRLPMSLADLHQILPEDIDRWTSGTGLRQERVVGYLYGMGWLEKGVADMVKRAPAALRDAKPKDRHDLDALLCWMRARLPANAALIDAWTRAGILRKIPSLPNLPRPKDPDLPAELRAAFNAYLRDDPAEDPYYSETEPFNRLGAGTFFFLRKP